MKRLLFRGGLVATTESGKPVRKDILVEEGKIRAVEEHLEPNETMTVIDVDGKILVPGLFDLHVHLREPGREDEETIESGAAAAVNGGFTGILGMPNTEPAIDSGGMVRFVLNLAREKGKIPVYTSGCITRSREGKELAEIGDMFAQGAVMITDDGSPVSDSRLLKQAMEYARGFGLPLASHCEIPELSRGGAMHEGKVSYRLGVPGIPSVSEEICIERDASLAEYTGARLHIQHISTARGATILKRYKENGTNITGEVTPHHLIFSDEDISEYDTNFKMNPPLRPPADRDQLLEALKAGVIDCIATDHAPHTSFEKKQDFFQAPFGITGLETALVSIYHHFIRREKLGWNIVVSAFSHNPRRIINLEPVTFNRGNSAEFLVFDPRSFTDCTRDFFRSKSTNSPFIGKRLSGSIEKVFFHDRFLLDRENHAGSSG